MAGAQPRIGDLHRVPQDREVLFQQLLSQPLILRHCVLDLDLGDEHGRRVREREHSLLEHGLGGPLAAWNQPQISEVLGQTEREIG